MNYINVKKILGSVLLSGLFCSSALAGDGYNFDDVNDNTPYFNAINWVYKNNIVKGYTEKDGHVKYKPNNTITRAEFVKMLLVSKYARWAIHADGETNFSDVYGDEWFAQLVDFAAEKKIIQGYDDGTFRPNNTINFAEASKIIALLHLPNDIENQTNGEWWQKYRDAFEKNHVSVYSPDHLVTRGEMADFLFDIYGDTENDEYPVGTVKKEAEFEALFLKLVQALEYDDLDSIPKEDKYSIVKYIETINGKDLYVGYISIPFGEEVISFYDDNGKIEIIGSREDHASLNESFQQYPKLFSENNIIFGATLPAKYKVAKNLTIDGVRVDQQTYIPFKNNDVFELQPYLLKTDLFTDTGKEIFTDKTNAFIIRTGDFISHRYALSIPFLKDNQIAEITWNNNISSSRYDSEYQKGYTYQNQSGCGSINYASVVYDDVKVGEYHGNENDGEYKWKKPVDIYIKESDLQQTGIGKNGEAILEFKDKHHLFLRDMYENKYFDYDHKISYDKFVEAHPVFFWKDNFGRLIKFERNKFIPQAECGKPVIYLYPETETKVHVSVAPKGGFSITIPEHGKNGWDVLAQPNGDLTEIKTGEKFPYLFWEGKGEIYESPKKGWVIPKSQADVFVAGKLTQFGFNTQEITDFLEFWSPRMAAETQDYLFISFCGTQYMNKIAPISISPQPDSILRVLMDYKAVPKFYETRAPKIRKFTRTGFTVTEWGGTLKKIRRK